MHKSRLQPAHTREISGSPWQRGRAGLQAFRTERRHVRYIRSPCEPLTRGYNSMFPARKPGERWWPDGPWATRSETGLRICRDRLGGVAQLVRALACHARGRGFESLHPRSAYDRGPYNCKVTCSVRTTSHVKKEKQSIPLIGATALHALVQPDLVSARCPTNRCEACEGHFFWAASRRSRFRLGPP